MHTNLQPFAFSPLENPLHAVILICVGLLFWAVGNGNLLLASQPDQVRRQARRNLLHFAFTRRSATVAEQRSWLPDGYFRAYGFFGAIAQWIGLAIGSFGLACLAIIIAQNFLN